MELSIDDFLRGLVRRIDALEEARSGLASKVEALQCDNECLKRESTDRVADLKRETDRVAEGLNQKIDGLTRENAILREEIAGLKYGESTAERSRKRAKTEHLALTTLGNDAQVHIASFLGAKGIACLGWTCRCFGKGCVSTDGQMTSLVEELAGQVVDGSASDYEKSVLVGGRRVKMLRELELMRSPLYFEQLIGHADGIRYSQPEEKFNITLRRIRGGTQCATAISNQEMKAGRHYVTFQMSEVEGRSFSLDFGVIRPIKDWDKKGLDNFDPICYDSNEYKYRNLLLAEKTDEWGDDLHCCSYFSREGKCFFANWNDEDKDEYDEWAGDEWEGMEPVRAIDDFAVGLLLDLDAGTLSVFKGGRKLGVMKDGLTGAYCWYVFCLIGLRDKTCSINIKRDQVNKRIEVIKGVGSPSSRGLPFVVLAECDERRFFEPDRYRPAPLGIRAGSGTFILGRPRSTAPDEGEVTGNRGRRPAVDVLDVEEAHFVPRCPRWSVRRPGRELRSLRLGVYLV
ncbi:hypothetical protein THAOC_28274, partial [Thalassiosira oceanica]